MHHLLYAQVCPPQKKKAEKHSVPQCPSISSQLEIREPFQPLNFCFENKPGFLHFTHTQKSAKVFFI